MTRAELLRLHARVTVAGLRRRGHLNDPLARLAVADVMKAEAQRRADEPPYCPYCGRVMTWREKDEQGACNDCYGGGDPLGES